MPDYEQLIKALRTCTAKTDCISCRYVTLSGFRPDELMDAAADVIEELKSENSQLKKKADLANVDQLQTLIHQTENALLFPAPPAPQRRGPMYILTNDGKRIFPSSRFGRYSVSSDHSVTATPSREFNSETLGVYPDDEAAMAALQGLLYALASGAPLYHMPPPASGKDEIPAWSETVKPC